MTDPLVSVIIPVYNGDRFLADALRSVVGQSYRPIEVIVVDDGSTDASVSVASSFEEVILIRQANQGVSSARNAGIDRAGGEFVAFLDADDIWMTEKLSLQVERIRQDPRVDWALCHHTYFVHDGMAVPGWFRREEIETPEPSLIPSAWLLKRDLFDRIGRFDCQYEVGEDADWLIRARDAGVPFAVLPDVLVRKRFHDSNLTGRVREGREATLRILRASVQRKRMAPGARSDGEG